MMTPEQIAAMRADAEAGTPGPWCAPDGAVWAGDIDHPEFPLVSRKMNYRRWGRWPLPYEFDANDRRIARVPDMEATIIAQAAEIERLKSERGKMRAILEGAECPNLDKMLSRTETECRGYGESVAKVVWDLCRAHQATVDGSGETL